MRNKGSFIVIDGIDGSGKATQTKLLVKRLKKEGLRVRAVDFPRYYDNFFGKLIGQCLAGEYGDFTQIDPHIASVLYAADRFETSSQINKWLKEGFVVVSDRYVSANQIHQGGKITDPRKRKKFLEWLEQMEYGVFNLPRPDTIFFLDVPVEISQRLLKEKRSRSKRRYSGGRRDVAETNTKHLEESKKSAIRLVRSKNNWHHIRCTDKKKMLSENDIHELIFTKLKENKN